MTLNVAALLNRPPLVTLQRYTAKDVILYALGVGVGIGEVDASTTLDFVYERQLKVLPTMAIVLAAPPFWLDDPAFGIDWRKALNAGQEMVLHAPLPIEGDVRTTLHIDALYDKGADKGALMLSHRVLRDDSGRDLATIRQTHLLRGDGGFGGPEAPIGNDSTLLDRKADIVVDLATRPEQALLYRLCGDANPLHIDPVVAVAAGFDRPILHGSCTFGIAGRAILKSMAHDEPDKLRRLGARFSKPVLPGDTISTEIWRDGNTVRFRCRSLERDVLVLDQGIAEIAA